MNPYRVSLLSVALVSLSIGAITWLVGNSQAQQGVLNGDPNAGVAALEAGVGLIQAGAIVLLAWLVVSALLWKPKL